jgi:hypothetical protein
MSRNKLSNKVNSSHKYKCRICRDSQLTWWRRTHGVLLILCHVKWAEDSHQKPNSQSIHHHILILQTPRRRTETRITRRAQNWVKPGGMGTGGKRNQNFDGQSLGRGRERADQTFNLASRRATMPVERHRVARVAGESELRLLQQPIPFCQSSRGKRLWTFCPGRRRRRLWMEGGPAVPDAGRRDLPVGNAAAPRAPTAQWDQPRWLVSPAGGWCRGFRLPAWHSDYRFFRGTGSTALTGNFFIPSKGSIIQRAGSSLSPAQATASLARRHHYPEELGAWAESTGSRRNGYA